MTDQILQFFIDLIPKLLLAEILDFTWSVLLLAGIVFAATQAAKVTARIAQSRQDPSHAFIHFSSMMFSFGFALTTWTDSPLSERMTAAFLAWGLAAFTARYGLAILKWRYPGLYAALNADRRKNNSPPPSEYEDEKDRRKGK